MAENLKKRLADQSIITFATSISIIIIRLIKNAVISRILGPAHKGIFSLLTLIPDFLASFGDLGFGPAIIYYISKKKTRSQINNGKCFIIYFFYGNHPYYCRYNHISV